MQIAYFIYLLISILLVVILSYIYHKKEVDFNNLNITSQEIEKYNYIDNVLAYNVIVSILLIMMPIKFTYVKNIIIVSSILFNLIYVAIFII